MNLKNHNAEKVILAGMIRDPENYCLRADAEGITSEHFTDHRCQQVYPIIAKLWQQGHTYLIRDLSLQDDCMKFAATDDHFHHDLAEIEGMYQGEQHWTTYLTPLKQSKAKRDAYVALQRATAALETDQDPADVADILRAGSDSTMLALESRNAWKDAGESTLEFVNDFETLLNPDLSPGILTGCNELDRLTGGLRRGELWIVSGQTSAGKSVAALQFAASAISHGKEVALFSLEMGAGENVARLMSNMHSIHFGVLRNPNQQRYNPRTGKWDKFTQADKHAVGQAVQAMKGASLRVVDEGGLTIERIEALCREMDDRKKLDLIVIDYVQLVASTRTLATHEELGFIVARMKQMAKTFHCPVISASQLNDDGRLAQSRAIGHHADVVMRIEGEDGIYMLKNRNGQRFIHVPLQLNGTLQRFEEVRK